MSESPECLLNEDAGAESGRGNPCSERSLRSALGIQVLDENMDVPVHNNDNLVAFNQAIAAHIIEKSMLPRLTRNWTRPTFEAVHSAVSVTQQVASCLSPVTDLKNKDFFFPCGNSTDGVLSRIKLEAPGADVTAVPSQKLICDFSVHLFKVVWEAVTQQFINAVNSQAGEAMHRPNESSLASYMVYRVRQTLCAHCNLLRIGKSYACGDVKPDFRLSVAMIEGALRYHE